MSFRSRKFALLLLTLACRPVPATDPAATPDALMEADREFARAVAAGRLDAWVAHFDSAGIQLRPGQPYVGGHETIRAFMQGAFADTSWHLTWEPDLAFISRSGDLGYTLGHYRSERRDSLGRRVAATGKYTTIWKRQANGGWKVSFDGGAPDGPPALVEP